MSSQLPKPRSSPRREDAVAQSAGRGSGASSEKLSRNSDEVEEVPGQPLRYPIARLLIIVLRLLAIAVACLWPVESVFVALAEEPYPGLIQPLAKIVTIVLLLVFHFLFLVGLLCWSELLQAFLDIAKSTEETAQSVRELVESRSLPSSSPLPPGRG